MLMQATTSLSISAIDETHSSPKKNPSSYGQAMLVSWGVTLGGTAAAILSATIFLITLIESFLMITDAPESLHRYVPWFASAIPLTVGVAWILPTLGRYSGLPLRRSIPRRISRWLRMHSLADHRRGLRRVLLVMVTIPFLTASLQALTHFLLAPGLQRPSQPLLTALMTVSFFVLGVFFYYWIPRAYRRTRSAKIRRSLRFYHRGVALRSFIPQWDNPDRPIYKACRISRRLANLHRASIFSIAACFSAAGSLMASWDGPLLIGQAVSLICILAMIPLWPIAGRIVNWSATIIDPFCRDTEEYEIFE
jgi:hypothetical protein